MVQTRATAFKVLPIAAKHPAQLYVAGSLALLALGALAVSYAAIAALVRDRGSAVATIAALIGGIGAFCGALVNVLAGAGEDGLSAGPSMASAENVCTILLSNCSVTCPGACSNSAIDALAHRS